MSPRAAPPVRVLSGPLHHFPSLGSTQDEARRLVERLRMDSPPARPLRHILSVSADFQEAGRGRKGRKWTAAPASSLLLTLAFEIPEPSEAPRLGFLTALAAARLVESATSFEARIKWPNDVLVSGAKIAGILVETFHPSSSRLVALAGIGLNILEAPPLPKTTCLADLGSSLHPDEALPAFLAHLDALLSEPVRATLDREFVRRLIPPYTVLTGDGRRLRVLGVSPGGFIVGTEKRPGFLPFGRVASWTEPFDAAPDP